MDGWSEKDEPPEFTRHIHEFRGKKYNIYQLGEQNGNKAIGLSTGILSTYDSTVKYAIDVHKKSGLPVYFTVNQSRGIVLDLLRSIFELVFHGETYSVLATRARWNFFKSHIPNSRMLEICHSEGAIIDRNAAEGSPESIRNMLKIAAFAPGGYIDKKLCNEIHHYISCRDIVPRFDICGKISCAGTTTVLTPHPDADLNDHTFMSPTLEPMIKYSIDMFKQSNNF